MAGSIIKYTIMDADTIFNTKSEQATLLREDLEHSLRALRSYQRELSQAQIELLNISAELREL